MGTVVISAIPVMNIFVKLIYHALYPRLCFTLFLMVFIRFCFLLLLLFLISCFLFWIFMVFCRWGVFKLIVDVVLVGGWFCSSVDVGCCGVRMRWLFSYSVSLNKMLNCLKWGGEILYEFLAFLYIQQYERESKRVSNVLLKCCLIIFLMHTHSFLHVLDRITIYINH